MTPQPQQPRPSPQGQTPLSMNMNVSPEKRSALKNYLEGYKDAIQKKSMDQLLPNISTPQMPMQQPMQPPMMMNMGGVVDVFEPQYMSRGGVTVGSRFTNEDLKGDRDRKDSIDKVIDILDERSAPVNVGMMPERRGDITIPMEESTYVPFDNIIQRDRTMGQTTDLNYQMDPKDNLGFVQSPYANLNAANFSDFMSGDVNPISKDVSDDDLRMDEDKVESINPMYEDFKKSQESMFAPFVNKLGSFMGYDDPFDLYKATQATDAAYFAGQEERKRDQDRVAAKLAEEQRLRDMIQGMLPPTTTPDPTQGGIGGMPTTPDPDAPETDTVAPDYSSVVVPSDRVPDFTIPELPSLPETSPLLPPGISPELIRNLLAMQGSSVTNMQEGGSVNKLDNAVDNFLNSLKG